MSGTAVTAVAIFKWNNYCRFHIIFILSLPQFYRCLKWQTKIPCANNWVLHYSNSQIGLFSLISLMVKCPCFFIQDVHINDTTQWIQFCNPYACVQRFALNDHSTHTSLVPLSSVICVNILDIVMPMYGT